MTKAAGLPDSEVVADIVAYLDRCSRENREATLVEMFWELDGRYKIIPLAVEVNAALAERPGVYARLDGDKIVFSSRGSERTVSDEDFDRAFQTYHAEFQAVSKRLETRTKP
jgi:hypothetical protein